MSSFATAAVLHDATGEFSLEGIELEDPREDEILVRLEASGICHTDAVLKSLVPTPSILGHEGTGVVERVGAGVVDISPGDRVIIAYAWCGSCEECSSDHPYQCEFNFPLSFSGSRLDGSSPASQDGKRVNAAIFQQSSFATHAIAPARDAVRIGEELPPEVAASLTCAVFTGAGTAVNTFVLQAAEDLLVFGSGVVGLSAIMAAANLGAGTIIAVDLDSDRLALASELGATHAINAATDDVPKQVRAICRGGCKHILDTTAVPMVFDQALDCLGQGGEFAFVTVPQPWDEYALKIGPLMGKGALVRAVIQGSSVARDLTPQLIEWYLAGTFPVDRMIDTYEFRDINRAFADLESGSVIKPVLLMPQGD